MTSRTPPGAADVSYLRGSPQNYPAELGDSPDQISPTNNPAQKNAQPWPFRGDTFALPKCHYGGVWISCPFPEGGGPKLFGRIINSLVRTRGIESDIQIFTDMHPALSSLCECHQCDSTRRYLSYCVSDTPQAPAITMRPAQVIRQEYYLSEINYARIFLAYSVASPFFYPHSDGGVAGGPISRYNDIPATLRKMAEIFALSAVLIRAKMNSRA